MASASEPPEGSRKTAEESFVITLLRHPVAGQESVTYSLVEAGPVGPVDYPKEEPLQGVDAKLAKAYSRLEAIDTEPLKVSCPKPVEEVTTAQGSQLGDSIVIPSATLEAWYDPKTFKTKIHQTEIDSMPEFFNGRYPSKTPAVYVEYRNFIFDLYRKQPTQYLSATTCRRHLSGDVNGIMRVHAFLEKWGLINYSAVNPYQRAHKMSHLKESSYDQVLVNAANRNLLQKNEMEYADQLVLRQGEVTSPTKLDVDLARKLNLLTLKLRPTCAFSSCKVGYEWYELKKGGMILSKDAFTKGNYPSDYEAEDFEHKALDGSVWEQLEKDLAEENQLVAQTRGESLLTVEDQAKLVALVAQQGCLEWKQIAEEMGIKNRREAIIEFLRIPLVSSESKEAEALIEQTYLKLVNDDDSQLMPQKHVPVAPLSQAEMYEHHCSMLIDFAKTQGGKPEEIKTPQEERKDEDQVMTGEDEDKRMKKRVQKQKQKVANEIIKSKLENISAELHSMKDAEDDIKKRKEQVKSLEGQLFSERVSLTISNYNRWNKNE